MTPPSGQACSASKIPLQKLERNTGLPRAPYPDSAGQSQIDVKRKGLGTWGQVFVFDSRSFKIKDLTPFVTPFAACNSPSEKGCSANKAMRSARLCVTDSISSNRLDPVIKKRSVVSPASSTRCRYDSNSGTRCTSSRMTVSSVAARNPRGSYVANVRMSGSSSEIYRASGRSRRANVVFPDCLGPVIVSTR